MRIGEFWGLPAPMLLLVVQDERKLCELLSHAPSDFKTELLFLKKSVSLCSYELVPFDEVSTSLAPTLQVVNGKVQGQSEITCVQLINEIYWKVVRNLVNSLVKGEKKEITKDLRSVVTQRVKELSFSVSDVDRIAKKIARRIPDGSVDITQAVKLFNLTMKVPNCIVVDGNTITLTDIQKNFWQYYLDRIDLIQKCIDACGSGVVEEELIFGNSFFYLVDGKRNKVYDIVRSLFYHIRDRRQDPGYLINTIVECTHGIDQFRQCFTKYVNASHTNNAIVTETEAYARFAESSQACINFFDSLLRSGSLELKYVSATDLDQMIYLFEMINQFNQSGFTELCSRKVIGSSYDELNAIGICGINDNSLDLFYDAISNKVFNEIINVEKSEEEVKAIYHDLDDIDALLDTLIPIGEVLV